LVCKFKGFKYPLQNNTFLNIFMLPVLYLLLVTIFMRAQIKR
jgi:hypothetical protein